MELFLPGSGVEPGLEVVGLKAEMCSQEAAVVRWKPRYEMRCGDGLILPSMMSRYSAIKRLWVGLFFCLPVFSCSVGDCGFLSV